MSKPESLEQVLVAAAEDPAFREALLADRLAALAARGIQLSSSEQKILLSVDGEQLGAMVDRLVGGPGAAAPPPEFVSHGIRPVAPAGIRPHPPIEGIRPGRIVLTAAAAATVVTVGAASLCVTAGVRPDAPPPAAQVAPSSGDAGDRADARPPADAGIPDGRRTPDPGDDPPAE